MKDKGSHRSFATCSRLRFAIMHKRAELLFRLTMIALQISGENTAILAQRC